MALHSLLPSSAEHHKPPPLLCTLGLGQITVAWGLGSGSLSGLRLLKNSTFFFFFFWDGELGSLAEILLVFFFSFFSLSFFSKGRK